MVSPLIELCDVAFAYANRAPVLQGCSFALGAGQRIALTGANGCGKTTLLHLAVGLLRPTAGTIEAFGRRRSSEADFYEVRCRCGLLFQDADDQLFCPTVTEDVAFGPLNLGRSRGEVRRLVTQALQQVGLEGYESRITHQLSGGEKRLVALATLLAMEPDVLLLDEPTGGLDEAATARIERLVLTLPQAMLIVSHDREFLDRTTTSSVCLQGGRLDGGESLASGVVRGID